MDAFFITDTELRPVAVNDHFIELTGYGLDDLKDKTLFDIIDEPERKFAVEAFSTQIAGGPPGNVQVHIMHKDGSREYVRVWARLVHGVREMSNAVFCIARKIDEAGAGRARGDDGSSGRLQPDREQLAAIPCDEFCGERSFEHGAVSGSERLTIHPPVSLTRDQNQQPTLGRDLMRSAAETLDGAGISVRTVGSRNAAASSGSTPTTSACVKTRPTMWWSWRGRSGTSTSTSTTTPPVR